MISMPEPGSSPVSAAEWESDADGWSCAASPGGGVLIVAPRADGSGWVPVWTAPSGHILWHGQPVSTCLAAQRLCEQQAAGQPR